MRSRALLVLLGLCLLGAGCRSTLYQADFRQPRYRAQLDRKAPFLKAHTRGGEVFVLTDWRLDERRRRVKGRGIHYDVHREIKARGALVVPYRDLALLETNRPERVGTHRQIAALILASIATLGMTTYCIASPVGCF